MTLKAEQGEQRLQKSKRGETRRCHWTDDQERLKRGSGTDQERGESEGIQGEAKISKQEQLTRGQSEVGERRWIGSDGVGGDSSKSGECSGNAH